MSGRIWGAVSHTELNLVLVYTVYLPQAVRTSDDATNPVYVSVGHKISLESAVELVVACSIKRVPEPIRQVRSADSA